MAGTEYSTLLNQMNTLQAKKNAAEKEIAGLTERIERLQGAYDSLSYSRYDMGALQGDIARFSAYCGNQWVGEKADLFFESCESGELYGSFTSYLSAVDDDLEKIEAKITYLNSMVNAASERQQKLAGQLSSVTREINRLPYGI